MDFNLYFKSRQGEMANLLKKLAYLESPTSDKKAVDACSAFVVQEFKKLGAKITRLPQKQIGDLIVAELAPRDKKESSGQILVLTHIDTVWPVGKIEQMPFYISGPKVFGPGVLDMKAGFVMLLFALKTMRQLNLGTQKKIVVFINSAEETGSPSSTKTIKDLARRSRLALCLEPALPGGALKLQRKGRLVVRLETRGKSAHGGSPEKGVSAIDELMTQLRRLKQIQVGGTTMNIGLIGGGEKTNMVAETAWALLDFRYWENRHREKIIDFAKQLKPQAKGASVKFSVESSVPPMEKTKESWYLFLRAKEIASTLNLSLEAGKAGGGSDGSIAASLGVPTLDGLGPDGDGMHAETEHLLLPSLIQRTALLTRLLSQF